MHKTRWAEDKLLQYWKKTAVTRVDTTQQDRVMACARIMAYTAARREGLGHIQARIHSKDTAKHFVDEAYDYLEIKTHRKDA